MINFQRIAYMNNEKFNVHVIGCGKSGFRIAKGLFPECNISKWTPNKATFKDILVVCCGYGQPAVPSYPGIVLYWDGEYKSTLLNHPRIYYLGPTKPSRKVLASMQVSIGTLVAGQNYNMDKDEEHLFNANIFLKKRNTDPLPNFLVYVNSNCIPFREKAFDDIVDIAKKNSF